MQRIDTSPTPNPHSLKITVKDVRLVDEGMETFSDKDEAAGHPLAERLFSFPGVRNVFMTPDFLTVTKDRGADWDSLLPKLERTLEDYCEELGRKKK